MISKKNENLRGRLYNFKFDSALQYLDGETDEDKEVIEALARMFGNCAWMGGDIELVVSGCVFSLISGEEKNTT